ncbi:MAG TPA: ATP-binding protein [Acidobacteriota bacterium]|nr:ATP-binding protein [Acidobacteriota bacterium]
MRKRSRFIWKLYASYVVLILLTACVVGVLVGRQIQHDSIEETRRGLREEVHLLRDAALPALIRGQDPTLQDRIRALGRDLDPRLTVIRSDGKVLADTDENPTSMDDHSTRPEIVQARQEGFGFSSRFSQTVKMKMMYVAVPVSDSGQLVGYVRAALPLTAIDERLAHLRTIIVLGALVAVAVALVVGFLFARRVTQPLNGLTQAVEGLAAGDYARRADKISDDELGQLAKAFNSMADELQDRVQTINKDRQELVAILGSMVEGVIAVDGDGHVVHMNAAARHMLQLEDPFQPGQKASEVIPIKDVRQVLEEALESGQEVRSEVRLLAGAEQQLQIQARSLGSQAGDLDGAVIVLHDVTELRRLEVIRRDFVANVSHELKTPITVIRGVVETILDDKEMGGKTRKKFLKKIRKQGQRLSNLVTDLISLSRLQSEEHGLRKNMLDLREPVLDSLQDLGSVAEEKAIQVREQLPEVPIRVRGDMDALQQAVSNLLDNAIKYTPRGGTVWVRVFSGNRYAVVEVEDDGIGIEPREQERIFERFYRVDRARSREMGGTGLGLAIVKHVCLSLGGQVSVESESGKGSIFRIQIPVVPEDREVDSQYRLPLEYDDQAEEQRRQKVS